jgi:hypothetical protein
MITAKDVLKATVLIHKGGKITWIESLVVARKLQIFYNIADEAQVQYEKSGIYFTKVLRID